MATASASSKPIEPGKEEKSGQLGVLLPYIIAIVAQAPLLLYYFTLLWGRPHYQWFPFALLMVAAYAWIRWPRGYQQPFFARKTSAILFWSGIVFGVAATVFSTAWFSAASMVMLLTSLFARTKDGEVDGKSLLVLGLPLLIILMPPNGMDSGIITNLQKISAVASSWLLDLLNFKHHSPGTTLNFPHYQYGVEQACSGIQSFFLLLFCTAFLVVSFRRPWYRMLILMVSAGFWAVFMNTIRIMMIPIADINFNVNLIEGLPHDLLGYAAMIVAILMILSTDQLLDFVFGRSGSVADEKQGGWFGGKKSGGDNVDKKDLREYRPVSPAFKRLGLFAAVFVALLGSMQFLDFVRSMGQASTRVRAFSTNVIIDLDDKALSKTITTKTDEDEYIWNQTHYERTDRTRASDFGQRSDEWRFKSRSGLTPIVVSLDQVFPGWHELTTCYKNIGWKINAGARKKSQPSPTFEDENGDTVEWPYIEVDMIQQTTGQRGYLLFSFCDAAGQPFNPPIEWGSFNSFLIRAQNRLFHSLRKSFFRGEAYQMQVFVPSPNELRFEQKEEIRAQYLKLRGEMRNALLKYGGDGDFTSSDNNGELAENGGEESAEEQ